MKVMTVVGTRPEIIRLSRTMALLDEYTDQVIVHTGQNYDYELNQVFWDDLELRKPDHFLDVDTSSLGATVGGIMAKIFPVIVEEKPDAFLVLGDTNSCLAAYIARRLQVPIFHMEAGNRCFDFNVPEEINRRIIDHISDYNLVYTEHARRHLISEGLEHRRIYLTGSPMKEVLDFYKDKIESSKALEELNLEKGKYFLISTHRQENVDNEGSLRSILHVLNTLAEKYDVPVIVSTHPRTRNRIEALGDVHTDDRVKFMKPFGFLDFVYLQMNAKCVISDSGTISEESSILSFPALSLRRSMERPEAQDTGTIILSGLIADDILNSVEAVVQEFETRSGAYESIPQDYSITNTSWRVLKLIMGNAKLSRIWYNLREI